MTNHFDNKTSYKLQKNNDLTDMKRKLEKLEQENQRYSTELSEARIELGALTSSHSWRLCAPFRKIKRSLLGSGSLKDAIFPPSSRRKDYGKLVKYCLKNSQSPFSLKPANSLQNLSEPKNGQKTILVMDFGIPRFDKDAGSKLTYMYLTFFAKMGLRVIFVGEDFLRVEPYATSLEKNGITLLCGPYYITHLREWIKANGHLLDYAYLNRPDIGRKYMKFIRQYSHAKIIYFGQDTHFIRLGRQAEIEHNNQLHREAWHYREIELKLYNSADVNYVVGSYELKYLKQLLPDKIFREIPIFIYPDNQQLKERSLSQNRNILFVGGFGHPPNEDGVLWFYREVWPLIKKRIPAIEWYIAGSKPTDKVKALDSNDIHVLGFVSDEKLEFLYNTCCVDVAPLRYGAGVKGKVVEALYNQIPLVTTDIGGEGLSKDEGAFVIANEPEEFANAVIELYNDEVKRQNIRRHCVDFINKYMTEHVAKAVITKDIQP